MPEHSLSVHPFVGCSHPDYFQADLCQQDQENHNIEEGTDIHVTENTHGCVVEGTVSSCPADMTKLFIDDNGKMGSAVFSARSAGANGCNAKVKSFAVREPSRGSVSTILRFQYDLPFKISGT